LSHSAHVAIDQLPKNTRTLRSYLALRSVIGNRGRRQASTAVVMRTAKDIDLFEHRARPDSGALSTPAALTLTVGNGVDNSDVVVELPWTAITRSQWFKIQCRVDFGAAAATVVPLNLYAHKVCVVLSVYALLSLLTHKRIGCFRSRLVSFLRRRWFDKRHVKS
jgi:hypothetical protein